MDTPTYHEALESFGPHVYSKVWVQLNSNLSKDFKFERGIRT